MHVRLASALQWAPLLSPIYHATSMIAHSHLSADQSSRLQVHITKPTWSNHHNIFNDAGVGKKEYRYYKPATKGLDFEGLIDDLKVSGTCIKPRAAYSSACWLSLL